jgi:hypothetical protein
MDEDRFDAVARAIHAVHSRRTALMVVSLFAAGPTGLHATHAAARHRHRQRRRCPQGQNRCQSGKHRHACVHLQTDPHHCGTCATACPAGSPCVSGVCTAINRGAFSCPAGTTPCSLPPSYQALPTCCGGNGFCATCIPNGACVCCPFDGGDCQYCGNNSFACCSNTNCVCCQDGQGCDASTGTCTN